MPGIARDAGADVAGSAIIQGSPNVFADNQPVARIGDAVQGHGRGPHAGPVMAAGSPNVFANNIPVSRAGDPASCGHPASGSGDVFVNDGFVPPVVIPPEVQAKINKQTERFIANPKNYNVSSNDQVKQYYQGTPEQPPQVGQSLIDPTAATAGDIVPFLTQILNEAGQGRWDETGMGGAPSNQNIVGIWKELGYPQAGAWLSDQTAWCMGFVNFVLKRTGYRFVQTARAKDIRDRASAYKVTEVPLNQGQPGDIALWSYSHVNFIYSANNGAYTFVGGNQSTKARNANNPTSGSVTKSWPNGYKGGDGSLVSIWRPVRA